MQKFSLAVAAAVAASLFVRAGSSQQTGKVTPPPLPVTWDLAKLDQAPATHDVPAEMKLDRPGLRAIFYDGLPYQGKPTRVFAWVGIPDHKAGQKLPAVVLIHGGGGTASDDGVNLWMKRGYAAIAMDTTGSLPGANLKQHADGGPRGGGECFAQITQPVPDQWMYHAVADVVLANSLLRSMPEINPAKIGMTGLSWGGVVAAVAAGVDDRFAWVAPVYGCGNLQDSEVFKPVLKDYQGDKWTALWDPSVYLPHAKMPMLWIAGTNDDYFQLPMWQRSVSLSGGPRTSSLKLRMTHSGPEGEKPPEILAFADSLVRGGEPLPRIGSAEVRGSIVKVTAFARSKPAGAELLSTKETGAWSKRKWEAAAAAVTRTGDHFTATATLPDGATAWYMRFTTSKELSVSSDFTEVTAASPAAPAPR